MLKIEVESGSFSGILKKIRDESGPELLIEISEECPFLENLLAFKILKNEARKSGKKIIFVPKGSRLQGLADGLNEDSDGFGFVRGYDVGTVKVSEEKVNVTGLLRSFLASKISLARDFGFILAILVGFLGLVFYLAVYYFPSAAISLTVNAESLVKSADILASPSAQASNLSRRIVPAVSVSASASKKNGAPATGSKEVGEKAKGEVAVFNKTADLRKFPAKSPITKGRTQGSDLIYLLDNEISIPPATGGISGVATVSATADRIGEEYNIAAGSTLAMPSQSTNSFIAEASRNFSGGSRRVASVVTEEDQKKLFSALKSELENQIRDEIRGKIVSDQRMEEGSLVFTVVSKNFDKSTSEEASFFNLSLEEKGTALVYSESNLKEMLGAILKEHVPDSYELFGKDQSVEVMAVKYDGGNLLFSSKIKGFIVPKIDGEKIKNDVAGSRLTNAKKYLSNLANISSYRVDISPEIPGFSFLPRNKNKIKIEISRQ